MTKYITIEGTDGAGKTTLFSNLVTHLIKNKLKVLDTKEFGSPHSEACVALRSVNLNSKMKMTPLAQQLVFAGIVAQHHEEVVGPARESGNYDYILSDRGVDSNYAYAEGHGLHPETIKTIFDTVYMSYDTPDLTIFIDIHPDLALKRRENREIETFKGGGVDAVEAKGLEFQQKVRENFLQIAKGNDRIKVIQASEDKTAEDVLNEALEILGEHFGNPDKES